MPRQTTRPDIAAARSSARLSLGSGRELSQLEEMLADDEAVAAITQCRFQGCFGLAVLTDTRFLFLCNGFIWKASEDIGLDRVGLVQWNSVFGLGTLTLHVGGAALQFTGVSGPGGPAMLRGLREHAAEKDKLDRQSRDGILAMTVCFASPSGPAPVVDGFPAEVPESYFVMEPVLIPQP